MANSSKTQGIRGVRRALATDYPEGSFLESTCPECLTIAGKVIDKVYCYECVVERDDFIVVAWRRRRG